MMYYIYCITNLVNNKTYIGQRKCPKNKTPETDSYMGSVVYLKNAKEKYGLKNFEKKIIAICETRENIDILEKVFIKLYREDGKAEYNMADGGVITFTMSDKSKKKLSDSKKRYFLNHPEAGLEHSKRMKGRKLSEETKKKISKSNKGKKMSLESRMKISSANKGKKLSEEHIQRLKDANIGKHHSVETRRKISLSNTGKKMSSESVEKMKLNHKGTSGKHWKLSEENKINQSKGLKGVNNWTKNMIWYTNGEINIRAIECPEGFYKGRTLSDDVKKRMTQHSVGRKTKGSSGMRWFTNGLENKLCYTCPEGFYKGRTKLKI